MCRVDLGAAYGTAKSGVGISSMGVLKPELIFKSIVPIIMAGILGIYGLIVAVILQGNSNLFNTNLLVGGSSYDDKQGYQFFSSGLCCGLSSLVGSSKFNCIGCWTCHWNCGRCWSESQRSARSHLRGNDPDPHLRRGPRTVRPHYRHYPHPDMTILSENLQDE